jgi:tripartite-type tricarboxylate transporter receptor subunit TctC
MIIRSVAAALIGLTVLAGGATAQDWPAKPVRIVTGFAAGGIGDLGARLLAEQITRSTGQQAIVENRTGAAGSLGMDAVAKAPPDGTTLGLALNGNLVINPFIQKSMPFDALKDLVPVAMIGDAPQLIAISADIPAKSFKEFQALAKAKPGTFSYGSAGPGSLPHLSAAEFARMAGIEMVHVPYRGNAPAITDLLGGRISMVSSSIGSFRPGLDTGKIRLLLTATKNRLPYAPEVPTSAEAGLPGYLMSVWIGVVAPAGTPQPILDKVLAMVGAMQRDETAKKAMAGAGLDMVAMSQGEFKNFVKTEYARWEQIVKDAGVEKQ